MFSAFLPDLKELPSSSIMASGGPTSRMASLMNEISVIFATPDGSRLLFDLVSKTPHVLEGLLQSCQDSKQKELDEAAKGIAVRDFFF